MKVALLQIKREARALYVGQGLLQTFLRSTKVKVLLSKQGKVKALL
jgi:hypothetical protein